MTELTMDPPSQLSPTQFVTRHHRGLLRWLTALGCDPISSDDHCQEALLAGLHHGVHGWPRTRAWAWLRTAARNFHRMQLRRERRRPTLRLDEVEPAWLCAGGDDDGGDGALDALRRCLDDADERDRDLLDRRYAEQQGRAEMAKALGIGEAGVKQALRRARTRLRDCMEHRLEEK
jgi:RNA polymerase sigma-70 factor (ECF subfamily)